MLHRAVAVLGFAAITAPAILGAQEPTDIMRSVYRTGPRVGVTWLSGNLVDKIKTEYNITVSSVISQFGWQYERQFASLENGPVALNEFVLLIGGLDQGAALPSLTWLVGLRTPGQFEIGVGPNATAAGVALAISVGQTFRAGALAIPVNIAVVPGRDGVRWSILTGFNIYR